MSGVIYLFCCETRITVLSIAIVFYKLDQVVDRTTSFKYLYVMDDC